MNGAIATLCDGNGGAFHLVWMVIMAKRLPDEREAIEGAGVAVATAHGLLRDADLLAGSGSYGTAVSLAVLGFEESVKARSLGAIAAAAALERRPGFSDDTLRKIIYGGHRERHTVGFIQYVAAASAFARDMGKLQEDYIGRQLATLPGAQVHPEVTYTEKKNVIDGVDWIVVFDDLVLLVEAKATRTPAATRAADETAQGAYEATLGKAFKQINRTYRALQAGLPEFNQIPAGRPVLGLVAALDPWYTANSMARGFLPAPDIPTMVASAREVEQLVAIGQRLSASAVLSEIMRPGDERQTWELETALRAFEDPTDRNPLLDEAWARLPFD